MDVADIDIKEYLKKVYKQAVFEFKIKRLPKKTVAFDLNKDGKIDVDSWISKEMQKIIDDCKDKSYDHNIFLVNKPTDGSTGFMEFNKRYGFVHAGISPFPGNIIAHELGHRAFKLTHTSADKNNVMYGYVGNIWRLREKQWNEINKKVIYEK